MTAVFLAWNFQPYARQTLDRWNWDEHPLHVLVSYIYLDLYAKYSTNYKPLSTILDSGAFSAWKSNKVIDIDALVAETKNPIWDESVALDVIGDAEGSFRNSVYMRNAGSNAFPVFHYGEPWSLFERYCTLWNRVGISCTSMRSHRNHSKGRAQVMRWIEQCFARGWPKLFHSFGWTDKELLSKFPFDTADASSWELAPTAFGNWQSFGGKLSVRVKDSGKGAYPLDSEIWHYLKLQRRLEELWQKELQPLREKFLPRSLSERRVLWNSERGAESPSPSPLRAASTRYVR